MQLISLSDSLSQAWIRTSVSALRGGSFSDRVKMDKLSCSRCGGVLHQAVTLNCGHSYCRKCSGGASGTSCVKCGRIQPAGQEPKTNVIVFDVVNKWWEKEVKAVDLRTAGNEAFSRGLYDEALAKYSDAARLGNFYILDFLLAGRLHHRFMPFRFVPRNASSMSMSLKMDLSRIIVFISLETVFWRLQRITSWVESPICYLFSPPLLFWLSSYRMLRN